MTVFVLRLLYFLLCVPVVRLLVVPVLDPVLRLVRVPRDVDGAASTFELPPLRPDDVEGSSRLMFLDDLLTFLGSLRGVGRGRRGRSMSTKPENKSSTSDK